LKESGTYLRKAIRYSFEQSFYAAVQYGLAMILSIAFARVLGEEGLGLYSYLFSLTIPLWIAVEFGVDNYLVRDLAAMPERSHELASKTASVRIVFAFAVFLFIVPLMVYAQHGFVEKIGVVLLCFAFLPRAISSSYFSVLRSQQRYYHAMRIDVIGSFILTACGVVILVTTRSLIAVIAIGAALDFAKLAAVLPMYKRDLGASLWRSLDLHIMRHIDVIKRTAPFAALNIIVILYLRVDVLLLEHFRNLGEVGIFTGGERFMNVLLAFPAAMYGSLLPMFSRARGKSYSTSLTVKSILVFMGIGVLVSFVIYLCAGFAIGLTFKFPRSVTVLQILGWSFAFNVFNFIAESWLYGNGREIRVLAVRSAGLAAIIAANCYFAPIWGAVGTAVSTTAAEIFISLIFLVIVYHAYKTDTAKQRADQNHQSIASA